MRALRPVTAGWLTAAFSFIIVVCNPGVATCGLKHGVVWYSTVQDPARIQIAAERYDFGVAGKTSPANKVAIHDLNPDFKWFVYNSASDNYVDPTRDTAEHDLLVGLAELRGWDPEECYMHYYDDTVVQLEGTTVTIPGWGGGSATDPSQARIPVYYKDLSRRLVNFSSPHAIELHKAVWINLAFDTPFEGSTLYPDGLFLDNSASRLFNYGNVISGGHVLEAPGHPKVGSPEYQDWHWNQNYGPFLTALKDTLETSASWSPDGKRKYIMMNIANIWDDDYVTRDATDYLFLEFEYNPVRSSGLGMIDEAFRRDSLAHSAGISCFYAATMTRSLPGSTDEYSYAKTLLGNLAWYLVTRTPSTIFYEFGTASPHVAGWDTLTWRGCLDQVELQLGEAYNDPFTLAQGTDPMGNPYVVKARTYQGGLVVIRNRGSWNEGIEPETAVTVDLPTSLAPMDPSGNLGSQVTSISLRNGEAAILVGGWLVPVELLSFEVQRESSGAVLEWEIASESDGHVGFYLYREDADGNRERLTTQLFSGARSYRFVDESPPDGGARYWLAELSRSGDLSWIGSTVLEPANAGPAQLRLVQNHPNPFRASTSIRFETAAPGPAMLRVFGISGREITRLVEADLPAGSHEAAWDGRDHLGKRVAPGIYFYRLETASGTLTRKLTLLP